MVKNLEKVSLVRIIRERILDVMFNSRNGITVSQWWPLETDDGRLCISIFISSEFLDSVFHIRVNSCYSYKNCGGTAYDYQICRED